MSRRLVRLLDALFASISDESPWVRFLQMLEQELPGHYCTMVLRKPRVGDPGVLISAQDNSAALLALQERIFGLSPFLELPLNKISILSEMMDEAELKAFYPEYYAYMREYGDAADLIGVDLEEPLTGMIFRLRCARLTGEPAFGSAERKILETLLPRLRVAIALHARIAQQEYQLSISDQAVGQLAIGSLVLDEQGQVLLKNPVADRLLQAQDGLCLRDGQLHCTETASEQGLYSALKKFRSQALEPGGGAPEDQSLQVRRGRGENYWSLLLRPMKPRPGIEEKTSTTVLVLLRDASHEPDISSAILTELFGLTPAEALLAERLVKGESLTDAAATLGRSRYTARAQLASIFSKTGVHRQPQLVSHIMNTVSKIWG